jgi:hypothetical protein
VVSQAIRTAAGQVAAGVICRFTRPAISPVTSPVVAEMIPHAICETPNPVIPHITTGVFSRIADRDPGVWEDLGEFRSQNAETRMQN